MRQNSRSLCTGISFMMIFISSFSFSQTFKLPPIPPYDSVYVDDYQGSALKKLYFLNGKEVFEKGYNTGSMFYVPFFAIGGGEEDSCYAYFNGKDHESYDFYYMAKNYIKNERFAENSKVFHYQEFDWNNKPIETGDYYFIREMYNKFIAHNSRYKIGRWTTYDAQGRPARVIDYDNSTINGKPLKFEGDMKIIDSLKRLADNRIIKVYGKAFYTKYVRFNLDRSGYYEWERPRPEIPGGYPLLRPAEKKIQVVDFSYDIVIGDQRFNVIHFRISRKGQFWGRTHYPDFVSEYFYMTQGLDSLNRHGKLHSTVLNWQNTAREKGLDITSKDFNIRMEFQPASDYYGRLFLVLEQVEESVSTKSSFTNKLRRYFIDPWTGEITEKKGNEATEGVMMEEGIEGVE